MKAAIDRRELVLELNRQEKAAYYRYVAETSGNPVESNDVAQRRISPKRVKRAKEAWENALTALDDAGVTRAELRDALQSVKPKGVTRVRS